MIVPSSRTPNSTWPPSVLAIAPAARTPVSNSASERFSSSRCPSPWLMRVRTSSGVKSLLPQVDVLSPGQLRVETGAHLQQGTHPAMDLGVALGRLGDTGQHLEQRRLARPVAPNACPEPVEGMPTTSPRFTSKETSFSAQMVSLETVDD